MVMVVYDLEEYSKNGRPHSQKESLSLEPQLWWCRYLHADKVEWAKGLRDGLTLLLLTKVLHSEKEMMIRASEFLTKTMQKANKLKNLFSPIMVLLILSCLWKCVAQML
ncbi:Uncharacterized protein TCM_007213 [Theobroma cacao]|uniref:Uncharacterized protein n=1 Tax=Theobroma cacao TaxID=3641 RepID=A0A061E0F2_THECC|nr:Uncharacterized protein TCM_007213 [Theobroma cacao]